MKGYLRWDGMNWPDPESEESCELEYILRHGCGSFTLSYSERMIVATHLSAYRELTRRSGKRASEIVAGMRRARKEGES